MKGQLSVRYLGKMAVRNLATSKADVSSLVKLVGNYPWMIRYLWQERSNTAEYASAYENYIHSESNDKMAISLRLSGFLVFLCHRIQPKIIIDFGSGFSSYILRSTAAKYPDMIVHSVDSDPIWLEATQSFLEERGISTDHMYMLEEYLRRRFDFGDLILFDIMHSGDRSRLELLEKLEVWVRPTSIVILDDMHKSKFRKPVLSWTRLQGIGHIDLKLLTKDDFGRYSSLLHGF